MKRLTTIFLILATIASTLTLTLLQSCVPESQAATNPDSHSPKASSSSNKDAEIPDEISFNEHIQPILSENCYHCHGPDGSTRYPEEDPLRIDREEYAFAERAATGKPAIIPGNAAESIVFERIITDDPAIKMPPVNGHSHLDQHQIDLIEAWIEAGAEYEEHWSFITPTRPDVPELADSQARLHNPIDHFVVAKYAEEGLEQNPVAQPHRLLRRILFDTTGLPPTPEQVRAFEQAYQQDPQAAVAGVIDQAFASSHYGEHQARHWLDLARYADTHGIHIDNSRFIWPYRDWVVDAYNQNMSFDQFTIEQIAGDMLENPTTDQLIATGYQRNVATTGEAGTVAKELRAMYRQDQTDNIAASYLALTTNCASCHDHKFDPLSTKENYQLTAFYSNTTMASRDGNYAAHYPFIRVDNDNAPLTPAVAQLRDQVRQLSIEFQGINDAGDENAAARRLKRLNRKLHQRMGGDNGTFMLIMEERQDREPYAHVLVRGVYSNEGERVTPDVPSFLPPMDDDMPRNRLGLAQWLTDADNPLPARVTMNRLWGQLFGQALVTTTSDFGIMGSRPSHPKLLDWLAVEFIDSGWDYQHMIRLILSSATYQQSATVTPEQREQDITNTYLARGPRYRLDAEIIRDQALAASGLLVDKLGGEPVHPYQPEGVWEAVAMKQSDTKRYVQDSGDDLYRRSIYTFWKRTAGPANLAIFNAPERLVSCTLRERTTTPLQAFVLMNDVQFLEASRRIAEHTLAAHSDRDQRIDAISMLLLSREFQSGERDNAHQLLDNLLEHYRANTDQAQTFLNESGESQLLPSSSDIPAAELASWSIFANTVMNLDETINK